LITPDIELAATELRKGNPVAIPTETVYGLAANAFATEAVEKIYALKQRPLNNPLIVHIADAGELRKIAREIPAKARMLAEALWPGPLTLVLKKNDVIPDIVTAGKETVAIRMPDHPVALSLLGKLSFPLAAPSANPFGSISPTRAEHVENYFGNRLPVILDGGPCKTGIESTIIGFDGDQPIIYRMGSITMESMESIAGMVRLHHHDDIQPVAPGMMSRHYAPAKKTFRTSDVKSLLDGLDKNLKTAVLFFSSPVAHPCIFHTEVLSPSGNLNEAATRFYDALHRLDQSDADIIIAENFPDNGLGKTLNDKLSRACSL
jgi:L-threonylcarbamoyladenylate synthase